MDISGQLEIKWGGERRGERGKGEKWKEVRTKRKRTTKKGGGVLLFLFDFLSPISTERFSSTSCSCGCCVCCSSGTCWGHTLSFSFSPFSPFSPFFSSFLLPPLLFFFLLSLLLPFPEK